MVMSQGTYTFLACFAGFWLVWAVVVMLCCFCSFLQRRLKRRREERLREQCLRAVEMEPLSSHSVGLPLPPAPPPPPPPQLPREPPQFCPAPLPLPVPHPMPQANWVSVPPDSDVFGKPPCYEEAVLMEDPPPPYSEVLAEPRASSYLKPAALGAAPAPVREHHAPAVLFTPEGSKPPPVAVFPERGYSSLIRLPSSQRWDSLGHLLSNMDLNHYNLTPPGGRCLQAAAAAAMATMPRRETRARVRLQGGTQGLGEEIPGGVRGLRGLEPSCGLPTAFPLLGRSTAV